MNRIFRDHSREHDSTEDCIRRDDTLDVMSYFQLIGPAWQALEHSELPARAIAGAIKSLKENGVEPTPEMVHGLALAAVCVEQKWKGKQ